MTNIIMEVVWEDSYSRLGWGDIEQAAEEALSRNLRCVSVGYLLEETKNRIVLVQSLALPDLVGTLQIIPRSCVIDTRVLVEEEEAPAQYLGDENPEEGRTE